MTQILINGVEWTTQIAELGVQPVERKQIKANVRGDTITIPVRSAVDCYQIQFTFPYLSVAQMQNLRAMFDAQQQVSITHTLDFPQGNYVPVDFAKTRHASLTGFVYTVVLTFALDIVPTPPVPAAKTDLLAGGITSKLGL